MSSILSSLGNLFLHMDSKMWPCVLCHSFDLMCNWDLYICGAKSSSFGGFPCIGHIGI